MISDEAPTDQQGRQRRPWHAGAAIPGTKDAEIISILIGTKD